MSPPSGTPDRSDALSPTGIAGLDQILRGGLSSNRLYMLRGAPGAGKTTLALQFLLKGAELGEKGLYITLSETKEEVEGVARSHGWSLDRIAILELSALEEHLKQEEQNTVFHASEVELNRTTEALLARIEDVNPRRLALDSLSELRLLADSALRYRRQMLALKQYFAGKRITPLLLDDHDGGDGDLHVQSIAHGVIAIEQLPTEYGTKRRQIEVSKLRGVDFVGGFHDARIVRGGLQVFPRVTAGSVVVAFEAAPLLSGNAGLDAILGGGLDRGTSCLLLGPAGSGKSTLAMQFAVAAAARGEKVSYYLFEENLGTLLKRGESLGMPFKRYLDEGTIAVRSIDPAEISPGEFVSLVQSGVNERGVRVIVLDSLNGYMQAMPAVKFLAVQLHELQAYLARQGVVMLMTLAQHGLLGQTQTPIDVTYLTDSVLLTRHFEHRGEVRKALSVVKKRGGRHESTIREFRFDERGMEVGGALAEFQGVLTGAPTYIGATEKMLPRE